MSNRLRRKIVVIAGSTASGKSALAVTLARRYNGEVISADSRQVYRGLDIGTGKITKKEMRGIPHHLLDVADPKEQFTAAEYQKLTRQKITEILSMGKLPIICGGTGLYIDAALWRVAIPEIPPNPVLRKKLEKKSPEELFEMLRELDATRAQTIDQHNPRRLVRAVEIAWADSSERVLGLRAWRSENFVSRRSPRREGEADEIFAAQSEQELNVLWLGLMLPPEELKKKIAIRLFSRISRGMLTEVKTLHKHGLSWKRMEALGLEYRFVSRHLRGMLTKAEMIGKLQTEIYRYAKRQMTWFKRNKEIKWFRQSQKEAIFAMLEHKGL